MSQLKVGEVFTTKNSIIYTADISIGTPIYHKFNKSMTHKCIFEVTTKCKSYIRCKYMIEGFEVGKIYIPWKSKGRYIKRLDVIILSLNDKTYSNIIAN